MRGSKALKFVYILPVCFAVADSRHGTTSYAIPALGSTVAHEYLKPESRAGH